MSVSLYFGLPGCGKTTLLASLAVKNVKKRKVYGNVHLAVPGYTYIDFECLGRYDISDALVLIDEATIYADSRDYKNFAHCLKSYMLLHRHYNVDIVFFAQEWASLDKHIRAITDRVYYVFKRGFLGSYITSYYKIPYGIIIPDPKSKKDQGGSTLGEIIQGYAKPPLIQRIFCKRLFRPKYYKYFDSWEAPELPPLPPKYQPYDDALS